MSDRSVRWVIIGCGRVADRRAAPAIRAASHALLHGFCSRDVTRAAEFAGRHEAPRAYASLDEVLADPDVAAVYLATPNHLHAEQAIRLLRGGRHVLTDKPMARTAAEAAEMVTAAEQSGRILGVVQPARFHPAHQHALRLMAGGRMGLLSIARAQLGIWYPPSDNWRLDPKRSGGGAAMDLAPHALDLLMQIGGPVARVSALSRRLRFEYEVEDFCHAQVEFAAGGIGLIETAYCVRTYGGRLEVYGSDGTFTSEGSFQAAQTCRTSVRLGDAPAPIETQEPGFADGFIAAINDFTAAVREGRQPLVTARDGLAVMHVIEAIYASARTGGAVTPVAGKASD